MDGLTVATDKAQYQTGETVVISGKVATIIPDGTISMEIIEQARHPYVFEAILIPDESGKYEFEFHIDEPFMSEGKYFVNTYYGGSIATTEFEIVTESFSEWAFAMSVNTDRLLSFTTVGQQTVLSTTLFNEHNDTKPFVALIEVRNHQNITVYLSWQSGTIDSNGQAEVDVLWLPELAGLYEIRTFVISDLDAPQILSRVTISDIVVSR